MSKEVDLLLLLTLRAATSGGMTLEVAAGSIVAYLMTEHAASPTPDEQKWLDSIRERLAETPTVSESAVDKNAPRLKPGAVYLPPFGRPLNS